MREYGCTRLYAYKGRRVYGYKVIRAYEHKDIRYGRRGISGYMGKRIQGHTREYKDIPRNTYIRTYTYKDIPEYVCKRFGCS